MSPTMTKPPVPGWLRDSHSGKPTFSAKSATNRQNPSAPINLSLSEDERSPNRSSVEVSSPQQGKPHASIGLAAGSSPPEEADPLYEYFPLSVDDWYGFTDDWRGRTSQLTT